jgi:hypothetical protein
MACVVPLKQEQVNISRDTQDRSRFSAKIALVGLFSPQNETVAVPTTALFRVRNPVERALSTTARSTRR